jgi:hypothetical protein
MEHYLNFNDSEFRKSFADVFNVDRMMETSFDLTESQRKQCNNRFEKQCCFDFSGVAAALLIDREGYNLFENVLNSIQDFNKRKIRMHFRFMLVYPYSAHAMSRIQAETSINRTSIKEPSIKEVPFDVVGRVESVDYDTFKNSSFVNNQQRFLKDIGSLIGDYDICPNGENRINIRFTPTAVNVCMYRINDCIFISPYLLAKENRRDEACVMRSPVIKMTRDEDRDSFDAYLDHFRYLWNLPQSIFLEDATYVTDKKIPNGISKIKPPKDIDYKYKSDRIKAKNMLGKWKYGDSISWRLQVKDLLFRLCREMPMQLPTKETVFIACAWKEKDPYLSSNPNVLAKKLKKWLKDDLGDAIDVHIVESDAGGILDKKIYSGLNSSTVGIVLLTCDIKRDNGRYYAKPNIYHELGYLMGKYEGYGYEKRVIPVIQKLNGVAVEAPTNISNKESIYFEGDRIDAVYKDILMSFCKHLVLDIGVICSALRSHLKRVENVIEYFPNAINWAESIRETIKSLPCKECEVKDCPNLCKD